MGKGQQPVASTQKGYARWILIGFILIGSGYLLFRYHIQQEKYSATPFDFPELMFFPGKLNIPEDNPMSVEGIRLGRYLFYDGRLAGSTDPDSLMSCATCHHQTFGFGANLDHPVYHGYPRGRRIKTYPDGKKTNHVTLPLVNLVYNFNGYGRNGVFRPERDTPGLKKRLDSTSLEAVIRIKITSREGLAGSLQRTEDLIASIPQYAPMFQSAFGSDQVTIERISKAIAQFIRSIIANRFRYYRYLQNEAELTPAEQRGSAIFFSEESGCFHCHSGSLLMTTHEYYNIGLDSVFMDKEDRFEVTGSVRDAGAYRVPSLINCELNSPYMHDGRFSTLREVINFYSDGIVYSPDTSPLIKGLNQGGIHLTDDQKEDLVSFLLTLTDQTIMEDTALGCPPSLGIYGIRYP